MNAWSISDGDSYVFALADTRGQAKRFHPNFNHRDPDSFLAMRVWRAPWLDLPGPAREVMAELDDHGCEWDTCESPECSDGRIVNRERTIARARRERG